MPVEDKEPNKKRIVITATTTASLLLLPYIKAPESLFFMVPIIAEGVAFVGLIIWANHKEKSAGKRTKTATTELKVSIDDAIDKLKNDISNTKDPLMLTALNKQLLELYEERSDEYKKTRDKIRGNIKKSEEEEKSYASEATEYKEQLAKKANEEIEKIGEEKKMHLKKKINYQKRSINVKIITTSHL